MTRNYFVTTLSLLLVAMVLISSAHVAQVLGAAVVTHDDGIKKVSHDDTMIKAVGDLHHHSDKSGSQLIKDAGEHQLYADSRSLRLHHKKASLRDRAHRWLRLLQANWSTTV
jgi:hypothetical protein